MHGAIDEHTMGDTLGMAYSGHLPGGVASILMNPANDAMNPISLMAGRDHQNGLNAPLDLMNEMLQVLHQIPDEIAHADMGGKDTHAGDLAAKFDPKMDQDINLYTGGGDDMVIIV